MKNAKEYLSQAYRIDQRINSKIEQVSALNNMAMKATSTISDMPGRATRNIHQMEDVVAKIIDLQNEINAEIDELVDFIENNTKLLNNTEIGEYCYE